MKKNSPDTPAHPPCLSRIKGILSKIPFVTVCGCAFFAVAVLVIGYYILFPAKGYFHSDCADTLLWAQASYDSGSLLNPDFNYACFLPVGGQLLMLPFIPLFGVSMTTHTLGMLLFLLLFAGALVFLFWQMYRSLPFSASAAATMLLVTAGSDKLREIFFGHVIYYSLGVLFLTVGLGCVLWLMRLLDTKRLTSPTVITAGVLTMGWCLLGAINQFEMLTLFSLPLIGALIAERFFDLRRTLTPNESLHTCLIVFGVGAATAFGYLIGALLVGNMHADYAEAYATFSDPETWFDNLSLFLSHFITLFGSKAQFGLSFSSGEGILELVRILAALAILITPVITTVCYRKLHDRPLRLLILAHWLVTALVMMGFVFGHLSVANWRLSPMLCTSTMVTVCFCRWWFKNRPTAKRMTLLALVPIAIILGSTAFSVATMPPDHNQNEGLYAVVDTMTENGWTHGYATFWNAGHLTVISDSEIACRNVELSDSGDAVEKYTYQSNDRWFEEEHDSYFLLLERSEYNRMVLASNRLINDAIETCEINDYIVLIFDHNIV